ncbi:MAG: glycosyltransferase family 39 protein [Candidatus Omnitrophica bacterium]|nr:glycosyltransferase family 39 protein [Candidatus Omnitrophota bacterium]MBU1997502.1 glycosyltransferase family 39 protein [Candidatus Omnitrophota bacterium]
MKTFLFAIKDNKYLVPLVLLVFSFFIRMSLISKGPYSLDSLVVVDAALKTIQTYQIQYFHDFQYPLAVIFLVGFINFFKLFSVYDPVFLYNFLSVFFSSMSVSLFYVLIKQLINKPAAFFTAILFSLCPIYLGLSVYGTSNILSLFFLFLCLVSMNQYFLSQEKKYYFLSSFSLGLMGAARLQEMFFILPAIFCLYAFSPLEKIRPDRSQKKLRTKLCGFAGYLVIAVLIGGIFYLPAILRQIKSPETPFLIGVLVTNVPRSGFIKFFIGSIVRNIGFIKMSFSFLGLVLSVVGIALMAFSNRRAFALCFSWILAPLLILACFRITGPRLLVLIVPAFYVGLGYVFSIVLKKNKTMRLVVFVVFVGILFSNYFKIYPILLHRHNAALLPDYARKIGEISKPNDVIICHDEALFIQYYAKRQTKSRPSESDLFSREAMMKYKDEVRVLLAQGRSVYLTWPGMFASEHPQVFEHLTKKYFKVEEVGMMPYEDWHRGPNRQQIYKFPIYRLKKKE